MNLCKIYNISYTEIYNHYFGAPSEKTRKIRTVHIFSENMYAQIRIKTLFTIAHRTDNNLEGNTYKQMKCEYVHMVYSPNQNFYFRKT